MKTKLIHTTTDAEKIISYCARVSSPNQENPKYEGLIKYCIQNKHWSIFEMATMCIEIETSRAIAQQILRHRSFHFQEFSQRYAEVTTIETYNARRQDIKNRQNSIDDLSKETLNWFAVRQEEIRNLCQSSYKEALDLGIAKEQARFLLPLSTTTRLYMHGTIRDWIHYIELRCSNGTQLEHQEIANGIKEIFSEQFPLISKALGWVL